MRKRKTFQSKGLFHSFNWDFLFGLIVIASVCLIGFAAIGALVIAVCDAFFGLSVT